MLLLLYDSLKLSYLLKQKNVFKQSLVFDVYKIVHYVQTTFNVEVKLLKLLLFYNV